MPFLSAWYSIVAYPFIDRPPPAVMWTFRILPIKGSDERWYQIKSLKDCVLEGTLDMEFAGSPDKNGWGLANLTISFQRTTIFLIMLVQRHQKRFTSARCSDRGNTAGIT